MITLADFKENKIPVSWKTIIVGRKLKLADAKLIDKYATQYLIENYKVEDPYIIALASNISENEIDSVLSNIEKSQNIKIPDNNSLDYELEVRKWRYIQLKKISMQKNNNEELLHKIEMVYSDFLYTEDMSFLIYYITSENFDASQCSKEECTQRLINLFNNFLEKEQSQLSNNYQN